jgi:hypothetical protein
MSQIDVSVEELEETREDLIRQINTKMTEDEKQFLFSFKSMNPDWKLLGMNIPGEVANIPSVRWKMHNLQQMPEAKHRLALEKLKRILWVR